MGIAAAALAAVAIGASVYSAKSQSDAAKQANKTNLENAAADRALQLQLFEESRGSQGSSLLPLYAPKGTESDLLQKALDTYYAQFNAQGSPEQALQNYQNIIAGEGPAMAAGDTLVNQLFSGELTDQQIRNIAPVIAARGAVAGAQKQGVLEAISQQLNDLKALRQRSGYSGGGSAYEKALLTQAAIPALQSAATVGAQADLASATDVANIRQNAINTQLQNINLPLARAANKIQLSQLPASALGQSLANAQQSLNWFKLAPQTVTPFQTPLVSPIPSTGAIVGSAIGGAASTLGNYYLNRSLISQLNPSGQPVQTAANTTYVQPTPVTTEDQIALG